MNRQLAMTLLRKELDDNGLKHWSARLSTTESNWVGLCEWNSLTILLNAHHVDIHPDEDIIDTIKHEVAHALTPNDKFHGDAWKKKANELGCAIKPCPALDPRLIDAIRSGATIEVEMVDKTIVERIEKVVKVPKYTVTRLQEKCPICGKVAKEKSSREYPDKEGNTIKLITLECFHVIQKLIPRGTPYEELVTNWWKPEVQNCKHEWIKTKCVNCGEFKLMDFQIKGARFVEAALASGKGAGVFDEMGLGKTIQSLAYLKFNPKRTLFIVKSAITFQWFKEILRVLGPSAFAQIIRTSRDPLLPNLRSYIVSYDLLRRFDQEKIKALGIECVVLDECQQIKNPDSTRTQEVRKIVGDPKVQVIALSGTPWQNRGSEFFPVLNMIDPVKFYSYQHFLDTWVSYYWHGDKQKMGGIKNIDRFKAYTEHIVIRREYNEVMTEYPDVNRMKLAMQMDEMSQDNYDQAESAFVKWYNQHIIDGTEDSVGSIEILAQLTRARHIIGLAKIPATLGFLEEFYEENDRSIVVFVHHKDVADILIEECKKRFPNVVIDALKGSPAMDDVEKNAVASRFGLKRTFLVASTLACGEGIDGLQKGYDSILHERQWNPAKEDQATPGRFKRIGQKSPVINLTCVHADETVDVDFDEIIERKRNEFHKAMNKGQAPTWSDNDIAKEMAQRIIARNKKKNKGKQVNITQYARVNR